MVWDPWQNYEIQEIHRKYIAATIPWNSFILALQHSIMSQFCSKFKRIIIECHKEGTIREKLALTAYSSTTHFGRTRLEVDIISILAHDPNTRNFGAYCSRLQPSTGRLQHLRVIDSWASARAAGSENSPYLSIVLVSSTAVQAEIVDCLQYPSASPVASGVFRTKA